MSLSATYYSAQLTRSNGSDPLLVNNKLFSVASIPGKFLNIRITTANKIDGQLNHGSVDASTHRDDG